MTRKLLFARATVAFLLLGAATVCSAADNQASDKPCPWSLYVSTSFVNKYVFRGMTLYDGMSAQPSVGVSYDMGEAGRINANIWMHVPLETSEVKVIDQFSENVTELSSLNNEEIFSPSRRFIELDPTISYDVTFDMLTVTLGHTWYTDPGKGEVSVIRPRVMDDGTVGPYYFNALYSRGDTAEFFASLALDTVLRPEVTYVRDYRKFDYNYFTLGFSQPIPVSADESFSLIPSVVFAWATGVPDEEGGSFSTNYSRDGIEHVDLGLAAQVLVEDFVIRPSLNYVFVHDRNSGPDDIVWGGVQITYNM